MCGSGTTLVMAESLNRHWIGCDVSKEYCQLARKRIKNFKNTPKQKELL
jgi:site-specific DNA-methyltransferase (adenine-specific)